MLREFLNSTHKKIFVAIVVKNILFKKGDIIENAEKAEDAEEKV